MSNRILNKKFSKIALICITCFAFLFACMAISGCSDPNYKPKLKDPQIKSPDIIQDGVLKIGVDFENPPLAGETSKSAGIDIDVGSAIADNLGLKAEFVEINSNSEMMLKNQKVDIVLGISKSATANEMWKSDSYIQTACALFATDPNTPVPTKAGADIISTQLASTSALAAQNQFNVANIKLENSLSACFESLKKNEVKYVAADAVIGTYTANNSDVSASIVGLITKPSGYCAGVLNTNKNLQTQIATIIDSLNKDGTFNVIANKWLGKPLDLSNVPLTAEASNQADAGEFESGVYEELNGGTKTDEIYRRSNR